ncbi:MAG: hypothetical protein A3I44_05970 [Candidatus Sungbacteria bacterium RIFCSPLOWO2_02_FULL_51_17]|uniref:Cytidyltransferase-like domain-containing protein n=1 Tax=Candidatus Sungbacteria bacterium RIFCSPHIGHO2_02_FULL_51_29 TaxID=1802273 RepID=A0A1G2KR20_9BACT|nr:MAG: hypothetical protein A3C16_03230 [Candidatus Sungbacteria bacterium RIFCSPHIGHO2_02_FULL_51_29]OHA07497.1 MAG: hypothetical protein A3B29_02285 [Candidatus Sungbacteria bacterium RIFCSPLOWO2_01_FULL_51_34]OHA12396.1 MAG: hypothetical protein A3I44_05970 [Candidatus Sungbacteria bacterium RIFCSPLOWO2_02_FULL_51_17]
MHMRKKAQKKTVVAVSGGFDPLHVGHVRLIQEAARLGDELVVIVNNDNWLKKKKGFIFMPQRERREVLSAIEGVSRVVLTSHKADPSDMSVSRELLKIRPHIFANGGDRKAHNTPEAEACALIGCGMAYGVGRGGKVQSSSWLVKDAALNMPCPCGSGKKYKRCHGA